MQMIQRVVVMALNTYREAVRARVLLGLFGLGLAASGYSLIVASLSLHQEARVVADLGAASMSLFAVAAAIVLGATSLHREIELKTVFPILTRTLTRSEYIVGKYFGSLLTLLAFIAIDVGSIFALLAFETAGAPTKVAGTAAGLAVALGLALWRAKHRRVFVFIPWALVFAATMYVFAAPAGAERQLVLASSVLSLGEVAIVSAIATLFSSFSSPFLTAIFTLGVFLVGRSADTLARLPAKVFGDDIRAVGGVLARVFPNLQLFVPPRPLLLGHVTDMGTWSHVGRASAVAVLYAVFLLAGSALVFRKRDFQ
jgi:Cu-processing system permease protein